MTLLSKRNRLLLPLLVCCMHGQAQNLLPMPREVIWNKGGADMSEVVMCRRPLNGNGSPEAYRLHVKKDSVIMSADAEIGFIRASQTLAQLEDEGKIRCCIINDSPAYEWRGVMLDVSRHFLPVEFLRKHIDILAGFKINRLHLHLTDAAGWRMEIKKYPRLTQFAAWRPQKNWKEWWFGSRLYAEEGTPGAYGGYYTQDELRDLVEYASSKGIMIIPEIEMPAHSEEVLTAYPELSCTHEPYRQADFCIGNPATFEFLENVLAEVMDVFPSKYIHIGGDEAGKVSWKTCPLCQGKMAELGLNDVNELQAHLIAHMGRFLARHGRELVGWDEILDETLTENSTVMIWRDIEKAGQAARMGHDVVLSPGTHCYFDSYQDAPPTQPEAMGGYLPLSKVYGFNPIEGFSEAERRHIRGIQGNVWAEYIPTEEHREHMLYPRILAIAEIGWNGTAVKDYEGFHDRALVAVDRLRKEGVNAFDLRNEAGERHEYLNPVKHKALGAKVIYNLPYYPSYAAAGDGSLTDGLRGGWTNNDGRWQGFIRGKRFDVVVDLGKAVRFGNVSVGFMQMCGPEIFFPASFTVSVSDNGIDFVELHRQETPVVKNATTEIRTDAWKGRAHGRYVRIQAMSGEFGGWIFADEIIIR